MDSFIRQTCRAKTKASRIQSVQKTLTYFGLRNKNKIYLIITWKYCDLVPSIFSMTGDNTKVKAPRRRGKKGSNDGFNKSKEAEELIHDVATYKPHKTLLIHLTE